MVPALLGAHLERRVEERAAPRRVGLDDAREMEGGREEERGESTGVVVVVVRAGSSSSTRNGARSSDNRSSTSAAAHARAALLGVIAALVAHLEPKIDLVIEALGEGRWVRNAR